MAEQQRVRPSRPEGEIAIDFEVYPKGSRGGLGRIRVLEGRHTLVELDQYPLHELAAQLATWVAGVDDDARCTRFVFRPEYASADQLGSFRIEPRPVGWQFTSRHEHRRHPPRPLSELQACVRSFIERLGGLE